MASVRGDVMRRYISLFFAAVISVMCTLSVCASDTPRLLDGADILSAAEEENITKLLDEASTRLGDDIVIVTVQSFPESDSKDAARRIYFENGYQEDGAMLFIGMAERDWAIETFGDTTSVYGVSAREYVGECVVPYLSAGEYEEAFEEFISYSEGIINGSITKNDLRAPFDWQKFLIISVIVGFVIALIAVSVMKGKLKSVREQKEANLYVRDGSLNVTLAHEHYLYSTVSRTRIERDSSGSHGGTHSSSTGTSGKF